MIEVKVRCDRCEWEEAAPAKIPPVNEIWTPPGWHYFNYHGDHMFCDACWSELKKLLNHRMGSGGMRPFGLRDGLSDARTKLFNLIDECLFFGYVGWTHKKLFEHFVDEVNARIGQTEGFLIVR